MKKIILLLFSGISLLLYAQTPGKVNLLNIGKMYIAPSAVSTNGTSLYVVNAIRCDSNASVILNGTFKVGGNFIQDSKSHVFETGSNGYTTSTGKMIFTSDQGVTRYITSSNYMRFNRGTQYIAFPQVEIETSDTISIPAKMGMDAASIKRNNRTGAFILKSDTTIAGAIIHVYDASLRITGAGDSENLVDLGSVIVEQYIGAYRDGTQLFPFATPFKNTQKSGYFAGNWVRRTLRDSLLNTAYPLGNMPNPNNTSEISMDQYVTNPMETFKEGLAYLVKPRPNGYNYDTLKQEGALSITGAEPALYDQKKFIFNGKVYTLAHYDEQLFADDALFSHTFVQATPVTKTLNWVIGNSYTAPLSVDSLIREMNVSGVAFNPYIYVYIPGSTSYQAISTADGGINAQYDQIPAKSIFMIRVSPNQTIPAGTTFAVRKKDVCQGNLSNNFLRAAVSNTNRDIHFRATFEDNHHVFDLTSIGLRETASLNEDVYDIPKIYTPEYEGFQLYTRTPDDSLLTANGVPLDVDSVLLSFKPQHENTEHIYTLTVSQEGNEGELWLKDLKTNTITDLLQTPYYTFSGTGTDSENRFIVYFTYPQGATVSDPFVNNTGSDIYVSFPDNRLSVFGLNAADMNAGIFIYDVQGKTVFSGTISQYPQQDFNITLPKHVYMILIQGQRSFSSKVIK
ncbi:MAG: hypothetical protein LBR52_05895 [Prevotellaceae bacterium]|jgi:hypothetical protein|nr:hypothetical protein [Prevotellaceae bacterium]